MAEEGKGKRCAAAWPQTQAPACEAHQRAGQVATASVCPLPGCFTGCLCGDLMFLSKRCMLSTKHVFAGIALLRTLPVYSQGSSCCSSSEQKATVVHSSNAAAREPPFFRGTPGLWVQQGTGFPYL